MPSPSGSVAALSSASATLFSIGIVFLGYWGIHDAGEWHVGDVFVVLFALCGLICLGLVPWLATNPGTLSEADDRYLRRARHLFLGGMLSEIVSVVVSVIF